MKKAPQQLQSGNVMIITMLFFVAITLSIGMGMVLPVLRSYRSAEHALKSKESYALSESGVEDVLYRLKNNKSVSASETLMLGSETATTTTTDISPTKKEITSIGNVDSRQRTVGATVEAGEGLSFHYGLQVGRGGLTMDGSSGINGNVYANGNITACGSCFITGSAVAATVNGVFGTISGDSHTSQYFRFPIGTAGTGYAKAHSITNISATGSLLCQSGSGNNKACDTSESDPTPQPMPISDANISNWESEATAGGINNGNYTVSGSSSSSLGPKKIVGDLTVTGSGKLTVTGTLWVTGNLTVDGAAVMKLASSFGSGDGVIVVDGRVTIAGSSPVTGSGTTGSYIMIVSQSDCPISSNCKGAKAIDISGAAGAVVLVAQNGTIAFSGSASAKQATGYAISLSGATTVSYESGLADMSFSSGPSGAWNVTSWKEK